LNEEQQGPRKEDRVERKKCLREGGVSVGVAGLAWEGKGIKEDLETTLGVCTLVLEGAGIATDARIPELCRGRSVPVRADLGGHLKYSQRWSGVRAGVLLGAQGAVCRGESRGRL